MEVKLMACDYVASEHLFPIISLLDHVWRLRFTMYCVLKLLYRQNLVLIFFIFCFVVTMLLHK